MAATGAQQAAPEVAVVGGGISGLVCARQLAKQGWNVTLLDMGKSHPGGRTSSRRTTHLDLCFDHGAQFFKAESPEFRALVGEWQAAGAVAPWEGVFGEYHAPTACFTPRDALTATPASVGDTPSTSGGFFNALLPGALYVGTPSMDAVCHHLARTSGLAEVRTDIRVTRACLDSYGKWLLEGEMRGAPAAGGRGAAAAAARKAQPGFTPWNLGVFDALVLADKMTGIPGAPGFVDVSGSSAAASIMRDLDQVGSAPQVSLMLAYDAADAPDLPFDAAMVTGSQAVQWIARDSSKPGRQRADGMQCYVVLATSAFSERACLRNADGTLPPQTPEALMAVAGALFEDVVAALRPLLGAHLPKPKFMQAQRWGSAFPAQPFHTPCLRADAAKLVACGDFCLGAGIENAAMSALAAAKALRVEHS